jgi:hypothetical protein
MHLDRYRWQDHVLNPYRWGIDVAVTGLFALALFMSAVVHLAGDPTPSESAARFITQTAMSRAPHSGQAPVPLDCDT